MAEAEAPLATTACPREKKKNAPVCRRQARRRGQPPLSPAPVKQDVEPGGHTVHVALARDDKAQRNDDALQVARRHAAKVDDARLGPAHQAVRVHGVHHHLLKVAVRGGRLQARQVDAIKVGLLPERGFGGQFSVQGGIAEGCNVDAADSLSGKGGGGRVG